MSKLYFRYAAMNAGKTTQLLQVAHNYEERGMKVLLMKPSIDSKGVDTVISRLGVDRKVNFLIGKESNIYDLMMKYSLSKKLDCILIDEAQFLSKEQVDQLLHITVELDIPVICYGLRTDFMTIGFEGATRLLQIAHSIEEMKTICNCGRKAILNIRKVNGQAIFEGEQVQIDNNAKVEYISVCARCYYEMKNKK